MNKTSILAGIKEKETSTVFGLTKVGIQLRSKQMIVAYTASIGFKGWNMTIISKGHEWKFRISDVVGVWKCDRFAPTIGEALPRLSEKDIYLMGNT